MSVIGRSDKMRTLTKEEHRWIFEVLKLNYEIPFPDAWKHFDAGLSPEQAVAKYLKK